MKRIVLHLSWIGPCVLSAAYAAPAQAPPKAPYIRKGVCPLECCSLGSWTARAPLQTYKAEGNFSARSYLIRPGEEFTASKGDLYTLQFGFVTVMRPVEKQRQQFNPGDILYILSYQAYDYYLWLRGRTLTAEDFWGDGRAEDRGILYKQEPVMVWWVQVKNAEGQSAWLPLQLRFNADYVEAVEDIDNMNDCG